MRPSDKYRRQRAEERLRDKKIHTLRQLDALVEKLAEAVAGRKLSPRIRVHFEQQLARLRPLRDALREHVGPAYDWIVLKGVVRGLPLN